MKTKLQNFCIVLIFLVSFFTQTVFGQCQVTISRPANQACSNGYYSLTVNTSGAGSNPTFTWMINGQPIPGAHSATLTPTQAGNYSVTANSATCTNVTSAPFIVDSLPVSDFTFTPNNSCLGAAVQFTASGSSGATYNWNFNNPNSGPANTSNLQNPSHTFALFSIAGSRSFLVSLQVANADGCAVTSKSVTVKDRPQITSNTISGNQTLCPGSIPAILTGSTPAGGNGVYDFLWEVSTVSATSGFTPAPGANSAIDYQPQAVTQTCWFRRSVSSGGCTSMSPTVEITLQLLISNAISPDQEICLNATPSIISGSLPTGSSGNYIFLWESSISGPTSGFYPAAGVNNGLNYTPGLLTQTTWFRRKVVSNPCADSWSTATKITVNQPIAANTITNPQSICSGTLSAPIVGSAPSGGNSNYTYLWEESTTGSTAGFSPAAGMNNTQNYTCSAALTQTTWFRRNVFSGGCSDASSAIQVTVIPIVSNNTVTSDQTICGNSAPAVLLGSTVSGGNGVYSFLWESSTDNVIFLPAAGINNGLSYQPDPLLQTTWFRRKVSSGTCAPDFSLPVQITVNPQLGNNTISGQQEICEGQKPAILTGTLPSGGNGTFAFRWEVSSDSLSYAVAPGLNNEINYAPTPLTRTTFFRRIAISAFCDSIVSLPVKIKVKPLPAPPVVPSILVCPGNVATLNITSSGTMFRWYDQETGGNLLGEGKSYAINGAQKTTTYFAEAIDNGCISLRTPATVTVPSFAADAGPDINILVGKSILLRGSGGSSYSWKPETGLSETKIATPIAKPLKTTTYTVTVVTPDGCQQSDSLLVTVLPRLKVPTGFTPNGDGINDTWEIPEIEKYPNCEVIVFNRWGNVVYQCKGPYKPWDGKIKGEALPITTYFYSIKLLADEDILAGNVTIIK